MDTMLWVMGRVLFASLFMIALPLVFKKPKTESELEKQPERVKEPIPVPKTNLANTPQVSKQITKPKISKPPAEQQNLSHRASHPKMQINKKVGEVKFNEQIETDHNLRTLFTLQAELLKSRNDQKLFITS